MDSCKRIHRMCNRLKRLSIVFLLAVSWLAPATAEQVPAVFPPTYTLTGWGGYFPTAQAACDFFYAGYIGAIHSLEWRAPGIWNCTIKNSAGIAIGFAQIEGPVNGTCPKPAVNPEVSYIYVSNTTYCERPDQCPAPNEIDTATGQCKPPDTYTITLSNGTTTEPGTSLPFLAMVSNESDSQPPQKPVTIKISLKVDSKSGGHVHGTSDRPRGGIANKATCPSDDTCWSQEIPAGMGVAVFNFNAPDASGTHTITATCDGCSNTATQPVNVMVKEAQAGDLNPIPESLFYALKDSKGKIIGAIEKTHEDNHHLTARAIAKLKGLATAYKTTINPGKVLYLNDASLEWGGLYDVGSTKWKPPHKGHRHGREIDIRAAAAANGDPVKEGAIPFNLFFPVWQLARDQRIKADLHCMENRQLVIGSSCYWLPEARHFHVNLN